MADVRFHFVSAGAESVAGQFLSVADAAKRSKKAAEESTAAVDKASRKASSGAGAGASGGGAGRVATPGEKLALRVAADQDRAAKRGADAQVRESKRAATEQGKSAAYVAKIRDKHYSDEQKSGERAAKRTADAQARESKRSAAEQAKSAQYVARIKDRHLAAEQRSTEKFAAANQKTHTKEREAYETASASIADKKQDRRFGQVGQLGREGGAAALGLGVASLGIVGQAAREAIALRDSANRISIGARGAGEKGVDPAVLAREFQQAALASPGVKATDVAEGTASFVAKTGDLAAARRFQSTFATTASATGSSVQDIAGAASDIFQKFDITGVEDMQSALAALTFQGKNGAFELKDAASQFAKMSSAASRFGLSKGPEGLKTLGGLTQIARSATGSSEQASTAVEAVFRQLVLKSTKLQGQGVQVFEKGSHNTKTRNIQDILVDTISKNKGSLPKLQDIFGDEGVRGVSPLISKYNEAANGTKGTEAEKTAAGIAALRAELDKAINAPGDWSEVVKDAAQAQQSSGAQLDAAWEQIKATVSDEAVPSLLKLVPSLTQLASEGIDPAITTFKAIAESGVLVADLFKFLGLIHPKEITPAEQLKKAKGDLAAFNEKFDKRNHLATPEETAEKLRLEKGVKDADALTWGPETGGNGKTAKAMTAAEFIDKYTDASGENYGTEGRKDDAKHNVGKLAEQIQNNPAMRDPGNENEAQKKIREDYASGVASDKATAAFEAGPNASADGGAALKEAAAALKSAADKLSASNKQPSVLDGSQL